MAKKNILEILLYETTVHLQYIGKIKHAFGGDKLHLNSSYHTHTVDKTFISK
jgi:hypothetical protein